MVDEYWNEFLKSGSVDDYLRYVRKLKNVES